jgi:hypothetical protein
VEIVAIGWATVEHERAMAELAVLEPSGGTANWQFADRDPILGASAILGFEAGATGRPAVVVLEPDTEGRLAAGLARRGEGLAAIYLRDAAAEGSAAGPRLSNGPLGPSSLVPGGSVWGPHLILVTSAPGGRHRRATAARRDAAAG